MSKQQVVAKRISRARVGRDAWVYELSEPTHYELRGETLSTSYVAIYSFSGRGRDDKPSVVIYPSDQYGDVLSYGELPGSHQGDVDHDKAVREAGWTLDPKSIRRNPPSAEELHEAPRRGAGASEASPPLGSLPEEDLVGTVYKDRKIVARRHGAEWDVEIYPEHVALNAPPWRPRWRTAQAAIDEAKRYIDDPAGYRMHVEMEQDDQFMRRIGAAEDFPTQDAAVEHAYKQRDGERLYVYHEAGKFHLAAPGQEPVGATPINMFRRPGEYGLAEAREDTAPVIYEDGAREQPGKPWPAPESLARGAHEHVDTVVLGEDGGGRQGDCLPWVRVTRDPERYEACLADARRIGPIDNARKVYELLGPMFAKEDQELLVVVLVDVRRQLRGVAEVHRGQRSSVGVSVADVMRIVITTGAEAFAISHGHPSGASKPSEADVDLTKTVADAVKPYGKSITFLGHTVIGIGEFHEISPGGQVSKVYRVK